MRLFLLAALAAVTVFSTTQAKAAILLEPYLGYRIGNYNYSPSQVTGDLTLSGVTLGARLAYAFPVVFVGLDYSTTLSGTAKNNNSSYDFRTSPLYALIGANLPLFRVFAGYALSRDFTVKYNPDATSTGGTQFKLGVGTTIIPMLAINLEYINSTFNSISQNGVSGSTNDKASMYMLDASIPFEF